MGRTNTYSCAIASRLIMPRILVVDDDTLVLAAVQMLLIGAGLIPTSLWWSYQDGPDRPETTPRAET